jgi:hypothetical protein
MTIEIKVWVQFTWKWNTCSAVLNWQATWPTYPTVYSPLLHPWELKVLEWSQVQALEPGTTYSKP